MAAIVSGGWYEMLKILKQNGTRKRKFWRHLKQCAILPADEATEDLHFGFLRTSWSAGVHHNFEFGKILSMKTFDELLNLQEPGWAVVQDWLREASNPVEVLPPVEANRSRPSSQFR